MNRLILQLHCRYRYVCLVCFAVLAALLAGGPGWAGAGSDGPPCPPERQVRATLHIPNDSGQTADDFHMYMYQKDKPAVVVNGASANCDDFDNVGVGLDSDNRGGGGSVPPVPPGVGPPYHGAAVDMDGGSVPPDGVIEIDIMLCMNEKNSIKYDYYWTSNGDPLPGGGAAGGFRAGGPGAGGGGGNTTDPGGGGQGAQGGGGGSGNYVHMICIENDSPTGCMLVTELKLLASMTYYADLNSIDWASIDPVKNDKNEPPVIIQPLGKWWYAFETTGDYMGGHIYMKFDMNPVSCGKSGGPKDGGAGAGMIGDHPVVDPCPDFDADGLWDDWEFVFDLSSTDDGSGNPDNGPTGDPDHDGFTNLREQTLLTDPTDDTSPAAIAPGYDLLRTVTPIVLDFGTPPLSPLPADFFGAGSDPFSGSLQLVGHPLVTFPGCSGPLGQTDTIIQRTQPAALLGPSSFDTTPIEVVGLSLVSASPISVTYNSGATSQLFNVSMSVTGAMPSQGSMKITQTHGNGGTFDPTVQLFPMFTFTEVANPIITFQHLGPPLGVQEFFTGTGAFQRYAPELDCPDCSSDFVPGYQNGSKTPFTLEGHLIHWVLEPSCPDAASLPLDVSAGVDLLTCGTAEYEFGMLNPPIPADFFGSGSEPFEGTVVFHGEPLGTNSACSGDLGSTDTIVRRSGPAHLPTPGSTSTIPIEIVALSLVSVQPIVVRTGSKTESFFDVFFDVSLATPSTGSMTITRNSDNGGTFTSEFYVQPRFTFREVGNPGNEHVLDVPLSAVHLSGIGIPWINDSSGIGWPGCASNFVPGVQSVEKFISGTKTPFTFSGAGASLTFGAADLSPDTDGDGLTDFEEAALGTEPDNPDSDGDQLPDGWEVQYGLNPLDGSGNNGGSGDPDGDGVSNYNEYLIGSNPLDPNDPQPVVPVAGGAAAVVMLGVGVALLRRRSRRSQ